jgi:hypothetical protein
MAGLLEVADDGFVELRQRLSAYQGEVNAKIGDKPNELLIDAVSLKALIESDGNIQKADELINVSFNNRIGVMSIELIAPHAAAASVLGFRTIGELNAGFQRNMPRTVQFASAHLKAHAKALGVPTQVMARGTSILSFLVLTAMEKSGIGLLEKAYPDWKQQPVESYKRILGTIQEGFDSLKSQ